MDELGWLRLHLEWGVDEALEEQPVDRRERRAVTAMLAPVPFAPTLPTGIATVTRAQAAADAARTLVELRDALANFDCALRATATNLVFNDGDPSSELMLVSDVPGPAEDRAGVPFAGQAALFLDLMLASVGINRAATQAACLLPWRPPGDRKPAEAEIQLCLPFLLRHLQLAAPRHIVLFGNIVTRTLLGNEARRARGGVTNIALPGCKPLPVTALPSVLHIQATAAAKRDAWAGFMNLRRALDASPLVHS